MKTLGIRLAVASLLLGSMASHAQAPLFRAYLSVNGNDNNACTLPAPCRLLPKAISVVADGGEIWMLDSANFNTGTVNVDKSVSILSVPGAVGSLVTNGDDALRITANGASVAFTNLAFSRVVGAPGFGSGIRSISSGAKIHVERCTFSNLSQFGIQAQGAAVLRVRDSSFHGNQTAINLVDISMASIDRTTIHGGSFGVVAFGFTVSPRVAISRSTISGATEGIDLASQSTAWVFDSSIVSSGTYGIVARDASRVTLVRSRISGSGVSALFVDNPAAKAVLSGNTLSENSVALGGATGVFEAAGGNLVRDNQSPDEGTLAPVSLQ